MNKKIINTSHFIEQRDNITNHLLCKTFGRKGIVEIVNHKNNRINYVGPSVSPTFTGPKGVDFQKYARNLNCDNCGKLLAKGLGLSLVVEIKCPKCKVISTFNLRKIYEPYLHNLHKKAQENLMQEINSLT